MRNAISVLDFYVGELKKCEEISHAKFVFAGNNTHAEVPSNSIIVAVCAAKQKLKNLAEYSYTQQLLSFDIYGRSSAAQRELTEFTSRFFEELCRIESGFEIEEISLKEPKYEGNLGVWMQSGYALILEKTYPEKKESVPFVFGDAKREVLRFSEKKSRDFYPVREFLSGAIYYYERETKGEIILYTQKECEEISHTSLDICNEETGDVYKGCRLLSQEVTAEEGRTLYKYSLSFESKEKRGATDERH